MVNKKTSIKQKGSSKNIVKLKKNTGIVEFSPTMELLDEDFIGRAILDCLKSNDPEGVAEVIQAYLYAKSKVSDGLYVPYEFKGKNPTLKTLARIVHAGVGR
jgi:hypothetical protein